MGSNFPMTALLSKIGRGVRGVVLSSALLFGLSGALSVGGTRSYAEGLSPAPVPKQMRTELRDAKEADVYLYTRVLDARGVETRDLYPGKNYTSEVRMAIPEPLPAGDGIFGVSFTYDASPNVRVLTNIQTNPIYRAQDLVPGKNIVRFRGERARNLDETAGVVTKTVGEDAVVARHIFNVGEPGTYAITDFKIGNAQAWRKNGSPSLVRSRDLKTVAVSGSYFEPVIVMEVINGNDHRYWDGKGVEAYFSVRNQRVLLEMSPQIEGSEWITLYSNLETCPSFTFKIMNTGSVGSQFFRIRKGTAP